MNIAVKLLQRYMPTFVKKRALHDLFVATAAAFGCTAPPHRGLSYRACLRLYTRFTQSQVEAVIRDGRDLEAVEQRLYQNARRLGEKYARLLYIRSQAEMMVIGRLLYAMLEIDFQSDAQGEIVIHRCYFSQFYSGPVCRVMSAMDRGLFAGLSQGGQLRFTARITEGSPFCLACFTLPEETISPADTQHDEKHPQIAQIAQIWIRTDPPNPPNPRSIFTAVIMNGVHPEQ
jgi:hypothetical protein